MGPTMSAATARDLRADVSLVEESVLRTVAYSDVFDYPLRVGEVHQYLHTVPATFDETAHALARCIESGLLIQREGFYALRGREALAELRLERAERAEVLWPIAKWYGQLLADIPFVRMVAVTGSLAWDNVGETADIDFLVVTEPGRLWLSRLVSALVARAVRETGVNLCANYWLSERALTLPERDVYTAYELTRMTPLSGLPAYREMRSLNAWTYAYFPNAGEPPRPQAKARRVGPSRAGAVVWSARLCAPLLRTPLGAPLERFEMRWRMRKISRTYPHAGQPAIRFGPDLLKSHPNSRRHPTIEAFHGRLATLGIPII